MVRWQRVEIKMRSNPWDFFFLKEKFGNDELAFRGTKIIRRRR